MTIKNSPKLFWGLKASKYEAVSVNRKVASSSINDWGDDGVCSGFLKPGFLSLKAVVAVFFVAVLSTPRSPQGKNFTSYSLFSLLVIKMRSFSKRPFYLKQGNILSLGINFYPSIY